MYCFTYVGLFHNETFRQSNHTHVAYASSTNAASTNASSTLVATASATFTSFTV